MSVVLELKDIKRTFHQGGKAIEVLRGVSMSVARGEIVGLVGQSGAGKSTLLQIAGLLEHPDAGQVIIDGQSCAGEGDDMRTAVRRDSLGFVYQFHHLLPEFDALENVMLPLRIAGRSKQAAVERAEELLVSMGLEERLEHIPSRLSGGEQQRVAIARALANNPAVLMADEPTGNLDESTAARVMDVLLNTIHNRGVGAIIATHNMDLANRMDRCLHLHDGLLEIAGA